MGRRKDKFGSANIRQVAEIAGVSIATVSRALQHPDVVRPETREKVMEAVRQTNFVSDAQARTFRQLASNVVIVLVRDIGNPFYREIYKASTRSHAKLGIAWLLCENVEGHKRGTARGHRRTTVIGLYGKRGKFQR